MTSALKLSMLINQDDQVGSATPTEETSSVTIQELSEAKTRQTGQTGTQEFESQQHKNEYKSIKKKRHEGPPFYCTYPHCNKSFHRSEHLSRHQLNHNPKKIYRCDLEGCNKTFVRNDLLVRHLRRHEKRALKLLEEPASLKLEYNSLDQQFSSRTSSLTPNAVNIEKRTETGRELIESIVKDEKLSYNKDQLSSVSQIIQLHNTNGTTTPVHSLRANTMLDDVSNTNINSVTPNIINWLLNDEPTQLSEQASSGITGGENENDLFFDLNDFQMNNNGQSFFIPDGFENFSPNSSLFDEEGQPRQSTGFNQNDPNQTQEDRFTADRSASMASYPSTPSNQGNNLSNEEPLDSRIYILDESSILEFCNLIPHLQSHPDFTKPRLERLLKTYWKFFHPRFPILHKPSFVAINAPPLLLLNMIILGCKLSQCVDDITSSSISEQAKDPKSLAYLIANPIRWHLFSHPHFQPPAQIYIIQSLLMLEFYEKNCSTRQLHERAHLHHGTTIQLLRRLPTLGGSPQKTSGGGEHVDNWYKWIEIESLKRSTFMCFYMDAIDGISFGHQMLIYAHQLQMTMPVEDELWEANLMTFNLILKKGTSKKPQPFLVVLKNILNGQPTKTNSLGKKVLVAGLCAIMFQIQQRDIQLSFGLDKFGTADTVTNWRDLLTAAFSVWRNDVGGSCCSSRTAVESMGSVVNSSQFSMSDTRCKCITYHMAHVFMSIPHYDFTIYAGAPWRMNVKPSSKFERQQICKRVEEWHDSKHAKLCAVQCLLLLFEMFLNPMDSDYEYQYDYSPDKDIFFRSNVLGLCTLVLWCYIYSKHGAEDKLTDKKQRIDHEKLEDGYEYLKRIRKEFKERSGGLVLHTWFTNYTGSEFYGNLMKWVDVLDDIPDLTNLTGLLGLVGRKLIDAEYTVVKEAGKLLLFCRERSLGDERTVLADMYD